MNIQYKYVGYADNINNEEEKRKGVRPLIIHNENLNTQGVIDEIVHRNYYSHPDAAKAVHSVFAVIENALTEGRSVTIDGFGSFMLTAQFSPDVEQSEARRAESIEIKNVVFKATKNLKKRIGTGRFKRLVESRK